MKKQIILAFFTATSAIFTFYLLKRGIEEINFFYLAAGYLLFPIIWGLGGLLIEKPVLVLVIVFIASSSLLLIWQTSLGYLICATLFAFFILWSYRKIVNEKKFRIKILIEEMVPKGVEWIFLGLAIITAVGFYFSPKVQRLREGITLPPSVIEKMLSVSIPGFNRDLTVDQTINLMIGREKDMPLRGPSREIVLNQLGLSDLALKGNEKISQKPEVLEKLVSDRINKVIKGLDYYIPIIIAVLIFQILLWANRLAIPIIALLDLVIYSILKAVKFIKLESVKVDKELLRV